MDTTAKKQKKYYDEIGSLYDEYYFSDPSIRYRTIVYDRFCSEMDLRDIKVLDAMSGGGEASAYFMAKGAEVMAVDISESCCDIYRKRFPQNKIICNSILEINLSDNAFDFIVTDSLHHMHPHVDQTVAKILRMLKPEGYFLIWEPSSGSLVDSMRKIWYRMSKKFFMENEESVDIQKIALHFKDVLQVQKVCYSGSFAYLSILSSMHFRINPEKIMKVLPVIMWLEHVFDKIQPRFLSCWVLCLFQKRALKLT